jgi:small-conductance mechanosensitive channel
MRTAATCYPLGEMNRTHDQAMTAFGGTQDFWHHGIGGWLHDQGLHILLLLIGSALAVRLINWIARRISARLDADFHDGDAEVRPETVKHRRAVASVISGVSITILYTVVTVQILAILHVPIGSLAAPAAVLGTALGFGAQRIVGDLLSGFFIITEKQYGFGDLVALTVTGNATPAEGTVEDVTLRITRLRTTAGEVYIIPNGQIVKSENLSKDWARAVIDIPVSTSNDLQKVNSVLTGVSDDAMQDTTLRPLLLDEPTLMGMGMDSIGVDTVTLRMVVRCLPGKQGDVGFGLRALIVTALTRAGITNPAGDVVPTIDGIPAPATHASATT